MREELINELVEIRPYLEAGGLNLVETILGSMPKTIIFMNGKTGYIFFRHKRYSFNQIFDSSARGADYWKGGYESKDGEILCDCESIDPISCAIGFFKKWLTFY